MTYELTHTSYVSVIKTKKHINISIMTYLDIDQPTKEYTHIAKFDYDDMIQARANVFGMIFDKLLAYSGKRITSFDIAYKICYPEIKEGK